ncbi:hypothetical protein HOF92_03885 [bacterium]|jgi:hypothetical protein|nr:hypothetical protein [bacterium]
MNSRQSTTASLLLICSVLTLGSSLLLFSSWESLTTPIEHPYASEEGALLWNLSWRISQAQEVLYPYTEKEATESSWSDILVLRSQSGHLNILRLDSTKKSSLCLNTTHLESEKEYSDQKFLKGLNCTSLTTLPVTSFQVQSQRHEGDQHIGQVKVEISYQGKSRILDRSGVFSIFSQDYKWVVGL